MINKIGILYICTGKYSIFWKDFYLSMEEKFLTANEKHYFVFTDSPSIEYEKENPRIYRISQKNLGWPDNTLKRFHIFLKQEDLISKMDYLFFFNANLLILEQIKPEDFLPIDAQNLLATLHPGYYNKKRRKFPYEMSKKSTSFVSKKEGSNYFAGGLNGGKASNFIEAMKSMKKNIDTDARNSTIAEWHDESHWNKYLVNRSDIKIIGPEYLYPEGWKLPFLPRILVRDKQKYGGHTFIRGDSKKNFLFKINKIIKNKIKNVLS